MKEKVKTKKVKIIILRCKNAKEFCAIGSVQLIKGVTWLVGDMDCG